MKKLRIFVTGIRYTLTDLPRLRLQLGVDIVVNAGLTISSEMELTPEATCVSNELRDLLRKYVYASEATQQIPFDGGEECTDVLFLLPLHQLSDPARQIVELRNFLEAEGYEIEFI